MANNNRKNTALPLERGLGILEQLSTAGRPLGITDPGRRLGLSQGKGNLFVRAASLRHLGTPLIQELCPRFRNQVGSVSRVKTSLCLDLTAKDS